MAEWVNEIVAPHYVWFENEFLPPVIMLWERLNVPSWDVYKVALTECFSDAMQASQSTWKLFYLTIRPFAILLWVFFEFMLGIGRIFFRLLLEKGWISLQKGTRQAKTGIIWFYHFQRSLSRTQLLGEAGIIAACILIYYLRKWLKRQTYVARATEWCKKQKKKLLQVRRDAMQSKRTFQEWHQNAVFWRNFFHFFHFGECVQFGIDFWVCYIFLTSVCARVRRFECFFETILEFERAQKVPYHRCSLYTGFLYIAFGGETQEKKISRTVYSFNCSHV